MLKPKTYKERNKLLLAGTIVFSLLAYWLAISDTVALYGENRLLEARLDSAHTAPAAIAYLTKELQEYDHSLSRFTLGGRNGEERLLQEAAKVCQRHRVTLIKLASPQTEEQKGYAVITQTLKLEGRFADLLRAVHDLEGANQLGRITSVRIALEEDKSSRKSSLFAYVYIQSIEKGKDHES
jgi:hypothetical protein